MTLTQIARFVVGLSWIYHGFFPKLLHVAPLEKAMTSSFGFTDEISYLITKFAGFSEMIFGFVFILYYKNRSIVKFNIVALIGLLLFVSIFQPNLLIEAFNPVTTNIPLICFSILLLKDEKSD